MSRSRRKTPIRGITNSVSEKQDKRLANRRLRRRVKEGLSAPLLETTVLPDVREVSNPWAMDKDGKQYVDPEKHPKEMRK